MESRWPLFASLAAGLIALAPSASASQTWNGQAGISWDTPGNWENGYPADDGTADVIFGHYVNSSTAGDCYLYTSKNVRTILFNADYHRASSSSLSGALNQFGTGQTLTLQAGLTNSAGFPITVYPAVILAANQTWTDVAGSVTNLARPLSGPGGLTKSGPGTVNVPAGSTFAGPVAVLGGTLGLTDDTSLGAGMAPILLGGGGALAFSPGAAVTSSRTYQLGPGGASLLLGDNSNGALTVAGAFTGAGPLRLDRVASTNFNSGRFTLAADTSAVSSLTVGAATVLAEGTGRRFGSGNVALGPWGVLALNAASNLAPGAKVTMAANSVLVLNDPALDPAALVDPASAAGAIVALGAAEYSSPLDLAAIGNGRLLLGSARLVHYGAATLGAGADGVYRLGGGAAVGAPSSGLAISGRDNVLTGANSLVAGATAYPTSPVPNPDVLTGAGLTLGNRNDFTGGTTLVAGLLTLGDDAALGSGPLTIPSDVPGFKYLALTSGTRTFANALLFTGPVSKLATLAVSGSGDLIFNGLIDLGGARRQVSGSLVYSTTLGGQAANGTLALTGGNFVLRGVKSASIEIGARVQAGSDASLGAPGAPLNFSGGRLDATGAAWAIDRPLYVLSSFSALNVDGVVTITGGISGNANTTFTKTGAGTLILSGKGTSEPLAVNGGTLRLTSQCGQVTVSAGTLTGAGAAGFTSVAGGAHVAPGDPDAPGTLTVGSGLSLSPGCQLDFRLGPAGADRLVLTGHSVQLGGMVVVNVNDAGGLAPGQMYSLFDFGSATGVTSDAFVLGAGPVGGTFSIVGQTLQLTTAALTPFQQWQRQHFGTSADPNAALGANPAGDGISNLVKYALGLDPLRSAVAGLPAVSANAGLLTLTYTRSLVATDIVYQPLASDDLQTWSAAGITQSTDAPSGSVQTVRATAPAGRRFMKLVVTRPP